MSLFRTIFAFENGREVANLGFDFTECLHSAFALGSLVGADDWRNYAYLSGEASRLMLYPFGMIILNIVRWCNFFCVCQILFVFLYFQEEVLCIEY